MAVKFEKKIKCFGFLLILVVLTSSFSCTSWQSDSSLKRSQCFNEDWMFYQGDAIGANRGNFSDEEWEHIDLPHDWSIKGPFDSSNLSSGAGGYLPCGIAWYRKSFFLPEKLKQKRIAIEFEGIYMNSDVWINGKHIGHRPNGYIGFEYDLTPYLNFGASENIISVKVDNSLQPSTRWYTGSGINRDVWLKVTNRVYIPHWGTYVTTPEVNTDHVIVSVNTTIKNDNLKPIEVKLKTSIVDSEQNQVAKTENTFEVLAEKSYDLNQQLNVRNPLLWDCENPNLYDVHSSVIVNNKEVDHYITKTGFRSIEFDTDKGFILNEKQTKIKGICIHEDAGFLGTAYPKDVLRRRLEILKTMNCNAIRPSHNPFRPALLDLCDEMGFLVMDEAFDEWKLQKDNCNFGYHLYFNEWYKTDLESMIHRDRNHPSIILYSIGNEIQEQRNADPTGPVIAKKLIDICHKEDPTRPVTSAMDKIVNANKNGVAQLLDVAGYNYQEQFYDEDRKTYPNRKFIGSENFYGYDKWQKANDNDFVAGQFLWIGFDYFGEAGAGVYPLKGWSNGLMDMCGFKKPRAMARQVIWDNKPQVYIFSQPPNWLPDSTGYKRWNWEELHNHWNWNNFENKEMNVKCYTNCDKVELYLNNQLLGIKTGITIDSLPLSWTIPYVQGNLQAKAYRNENEVASYQLKTSNDPYAILLTCDKKELQTGKDHVAHIEVNVIDKNGDLVPTAENKIEVKVNNSGEVLSIGSGNIYSNESFNNTSRRTFQGKALIVVKATSTDKPIEIEVTSNGLKKSQLMLKTN